jgi:hypothetical protein
MARAEFRAARLAAAVCFVLLGTASIVSVHAAVCATGYTLFEDLQSLEGTPSCLRLYSGASAEKSNRAARATCTADHPLGRLVTFRSTSTHPNYSMLGVLRGLFQAAAVSGNAVSTLVWVGGEQDSYGGTAGDLRRTGWTWNDTTNVSNMAELWDVGQPEYVPGPVGRLRGFAAVCVMPQRYCPGFRPAASGSLLHGPVLSHIHVCFFHVECRVVGLQ